MDAFAVQSNPRIVVALPMPGIRSANWVHHILLEHIVQRPLPEMGKCKRERIYADIIEFPKLADRRRTAVGNEVINQVSGGPRSRVSA